MVTVPLLAVTWMALALPANTPEQVVRKLADATTETLKEPSVISYFKEQGAILLPLRGERLADFIEKQRPMMKELFARAKVEAE